MGFRERRFYGGVYGVAAAMRGFAAFRVIFQTPP